MKANELLHRRLTVEDAAEAHIDRAGTAPEIGFGTFILSAPTPFARDDVAALKCRCAGGDRAHFPDAAELYARMGWQLPASIDRVYDAGLSNAVLGFRCATISRLLQALREGAPLPVRHDAGYISPKE
jgi:UDP-glucose 4-epimerase